MTKSNNNKIISNFLSICGIVGEKLGKTNDKNNIMRECREIFLNSKFVKKFDTNPYFLCCSNGVIDLKNNIFRDGQRDDMCSLSTNIPYIKQAEFTPEIQENANKLSDFLNQVFPFEQVRVL